MLEFVRTVAGRLVEDLQRGESATRGWRDPERSDEVVHAALSDCLEQLAETGCWGEANRLPSGELWRIAGGWLEHGWLQRHARTKPRGYAGDFEMLEKICSGWLSGGPLGQSLDRFFQRQTAPQAVRNRTELCAEAVCQRGQSAGGEGIHVVSVGSGPGRDVFRALERMTETERRRLRVTLLDLDPAALDFAANRLVQAGLSPGNLNPVRENLFRIARRPRAAELFAGAGLVICSGLFDYLSDEHAAEMLKALANHARQDARILVFNFSARNPSRAYMEWIGNWYLTYREPQALRQLARDAGFSPQRIRVGSEATGASLFLDVDGAAG